MSYEQIGAMKMPPDFPYREVCKKGRPRHERYDGFWGKHPPMSMGRRAKIFAPFDALSGYAQAIEEKRINYVEPHQLSPEQTLEMDQTLERLGRLTANRRAVRENQVWVRAEYFVPCQDVERLFVGNKGTYRILSGICQGVDAYERTLRIGEEELSWDRLYSLKIL